jgi:hypothetical protein
MNEALEATIKHLATKASGANSALEAMQFTQAALNAANALIGLKLNNKK